MTIDERAKNIAEVYEHYYGVRGLRKEITDALTVQDNIARQEERERCIKAFRDWYCNFKCLRKGSHDCESICGMHSSIIDAVEGKI